MRAPDTAAAPDAGERHDDAAYLGVTKSARGYRWQDRLANDQRPTALAISQRHDLPELIGRVLAARGAGLDDIDTLLNPSIKALMPDPSALLDMDTAASRLADAVLGGEEIAIFGDYDVDGACSSALCRLFLRAHGLDARIYIPDRLTEGYGPNPDAIRTLADEGASLIVTVDCGTTSFAPLDVAREIGVNVVVVDHHQADETLPAAVAVVNPNRQDDLSGQGHLCAAGVVFLLLVATARELRARGAYPDRWPAPDLMSLLDLVGLATVCDVVPLQGLNRAYVTRGLDVMKRRRNAGVRSLFDAAGLSQEPNTYHLGFVLGPRINAGGRIGDAALGARLLSTDDEAEAAKIAGLLDRLNRERKSLETKMLEDAMAMAEARLAAEPDLPILMLGSPDWHKGVVGLVASRLTERFRMPSCVIAWTGEGASEHGTGSLRSVAGVDVGGAVRAATAEGLLVKGGGHAMAAGLTVSRDKLKAAEAFIADRIGSGTQDAQAAAALHIDGALIPSAATVDLVAQLERVGPYGQGNPQPRFVFPAHRVKFAKIVGEAHVRCSLEASDGSRIDAIAFRAAGQPIGEALLDARNHTVHVAGTIKRDTWGGREKIEMMIDDVAIPGRRT
ncbi:MAG: single-stranded-DNA-specific exonuclease RecJ [Pseudomonadota bacterium]